MKEKPILFSGEMVRAILDGRKTMTRRCVKRPFTIIQFTDGPWPVDGKAKPCPYGAPGDRLWVRERLHFQLDEGWVYVADMSLVPDEVDFSKRTPYCPSIHMPRWASRITLEVTAVRVERVHDIGKDGRKASDVLAEGVTADAIAREREWFHQDDSPALAFSRLWDSINGKRKGCSWADNPWVWCVSFRRVTP